MKIRKLIRKFPELAHMSEREQTIFLEKARYEAFNTLGLASRAAFYMLICLLLTLVISIIPVLLLGLPNLYSLIFLAIGILLGNFLYGHLYQGLLTRGLHSLLTTRGDNRNFVNDGIASVVLTDYPAPR